ncbi:uncharacterized protein LOC115736055 isoform X2 [Rhodamnia argentea]|uniref:Uncharacterized protein LOC115736055 isoform X2 n=1 Tax=Rhodamnia argentea TaxID=178133 RepID=A0A8B8NLN8_9MYRT|nr:uncharacterized protein LOC115736055 isoform X2 [Rhodamnia argentea]
MATSSTYAALTSVFTLSLSPPLLSSFSSSASAAAAAAASSSFQCLYPSRTRRKLVWVLNPRAPGGPVCSTQVLKEGTRDESAIDKSLLDFEEASSDDELWAASCLRVRTFNQFKPSTYAVEDHKRSLAECEFEALKERIAGKREGFRRVSCINATLPMSQIMTGSNDLFSTCKFSKSGKDRVVVATLDLNQCLWLPDEIVGARPEGIGADFARAYLSNVCVAEELQRNGLGYALIAKSKIVAKKWGITDLYVHVAVDNEAAKNLYMKSGFAYESEEPAWQARFLDRPRRILLWSSVATSHDL